MNKKIPKIAAAIILLVGLAVMLSWIFDGKTFENISPASVTMKFTTALCFFLSALVLYAFSGADGGRESLWRVVSILSSFAIFTIMGTFFITDLLQVDTGLEYIFVKDMPGAYLDISDYPSLLTVIIFFITALFGFSNSLGLFQKYHVGKIVGIFMAAIGAVAVAGYIFNAPVLYYTFPVISNSMAFLTAVSFIILGAGFLAVSPPKENNEA